MPSPFPEGVNSGQTHPMWALEVQCGEAKRSEGNVFRTNYGDFAQKGPDTLLLVLL